MRLTKCSLALASILMSFSSFSDDCFTHDDSKIGTDDAYTKSFMESCLAHQDDPVAQLNLGILYYNGHGVDRNYGEALKWLRKGAEGGSAQSAYVLGLMYLNGQGVEADAGEAVRWQRKGVELGSPKSMLELGTYTLLGQNGIKRNVTEGLRLIKQAGEQGLADAQNYLGYLYAKGEDAEQDLAKAVIWYRKAADQGDAM